MGSPLQFKDSKESPGAIFNVMFGEVRLGILMRDVDGYYYFWPDPKKSMGAWSAHVMESIAKQIYDLNREWDRQVVRGLKAVRKNLPAIEAAVSKSKEVQNVDEGKAGEPKQSL